MYRLLCFRALIQGIQISERGVVFFREQDDLTISEQLELVDRLGRETGKPKESGLHIHPIQDIRNELGDSTGAQKANAQDEVLTISCEWESFLMH